MRPKPRSHKGQTFVEYALVLTFVAILALGAINFYLESVRVMFGVHQASLNLPTVTVTTVADSSVTPVPTLTPTPTLIPPANTPTTTPTPVPTVTLAPTQTPLPTSTPVVVSTPTPEPLPWYCVYWPWLAACN